MALIDFTGVVTQLRRIADALEHFVECDRIAAEDEIRRRTTPRRPVELSTADPAAMQARWEHERVEDGFDVEAEREGR